MNCRLNIILLLVVIAAVSSAAQDRFEPTEFHQITPNEGLSQGSVSSMLQDPFGFLWFGTFDGLNSYDGYSFTQFRNTFDDSARFLGRTITSMLVTRDSMLWIGTQFSGLERYDPFTGRFLHSSIVEQHVLPFRDRSITALMQDPSGMLWVGTTKNGLFMVAPEQFYSDSLTFRKVSLPIAMNTSMVLEIQKIYCDRFRTIWVATNRGLYYRRDNELTFTHFSAVDIVPAITLSIFEIGNSLFIGTNLFGVLQINGEQEQQEVRYRRVRNSHAFSSLKVATAVQERDGIYWLGTVSTSLVRYDQAKNSYQQIMLHRLNHPGDKFENIRSMMIDRESILWIGTNGGGIFKYPLRKSVFSSLRYLSDDDNSLPSSSARGIYEDDEGDVWIGTYAGIGRYTPRYGMVRRYPVENIYTISAHPRFPGYLLLGSEGAGLKIFQKSTGEVTELRRSSRIHTLSKRHQFIFATYVDRSGTVWCGSYHGLLRISFGSALVAPFEGMHAEEFPINMLDRESAGENHVTAIFEDGDGVLWIGTKNRGMLRFDKSTGTFTSPDYDPKEHHSLSTMSIKCIAEDAEGALWIGTEGAGVLRWPRTQRRSNVFTAERFSTENGLPNDVVYGILVSGTGSLWMSTNNGLARFYPLSRTLEAFDVGSGLQSNEFNTGSFAAARNGTLYFGGVNGVTFFNPLSFSRQTREAPVVLTSILIRNQPRTFSRPVYLLDRIELPYTENSMSLEFSALSFALPWSTEYRYQMEGLDSGWIMLGTRRFVSFGYLPPGDYVFRVRAKISGEEWGQRDASLAITIIPPFYEQEWFRTVIGLIIVFLGPAIYFVRIRQLKREKLRQQAVSHALIDRQEMERNRIARELHDQLGQDLLLLSNTAAIAASKMKGKNSALKTLNELSGMATDAINHVRAIVRDLKPTQLEFLGLTETITTIASTMLQATNIELHSEIQSIDEAFERQNEVNIVRCVQEAVNNIIKHSWATRVDLRIAQTDRMVTIIISDNGKGLPEEIATGNPDSIIKNGGFGMVNIYERLEQMHGTLRVQSASGSGTTLEFHIPKPTST